MELLYLVSSWDRFAKLRVHTESSLHVLEKLTSALGTQFRQFLHKVCKRHDTHLLPKEVAARIRRAAKNKNPTPSNPTTAKFHLNFYKYHAIGHVAQMIRQSGTTGNYSTSGVCFLNIPKSRLTFPLVRSSTHPSENNLQDLYQQGPLRLTDCSMGATNAAYQEDYGS